MSYSNRFMVQDISRSETNCHHHTGNHILTPDRAYYVMFWFVDLLSEWTVCILTKNGLRMRRLNHSQEIYSLDGMPSVSVYIKPIHVNLLGRSPLQHTPNLHCPASNLHKHCTFCRWCRRRRRRHHVNAALHLEFIVTQTLCSSK